MKKRDLASLAMIAISAFLLVGGCPGQPQPQKNMPPPPAGMGGTPAQMNNDVQAFYNSLSPDAQRKFDMLDDSHRRMAMESSTGTGAKDPNKAVETQYNNQMQLQGQNGSKRGTTY